MAVRREYPDAPIVTVGLIVQRAGQVLLVQRGKDPNKGRWSIPGGAVEVGEPLRQAGQREVMEECGIEVRPGALIDVFDTIVPDADGRTRYHYVIIDFLADYVSGDLRPATDVMDARWMTRQDLDHFDITERARSLVMKLLS
jgi:8-oxo-dGTP diphosphatase